jgi:hypothetical protein
MKESFDFHCTICGKNFGDDVIKLAKHIGIMHDFTRK